MRDNGSKNKSEELCYSSIQRIPGIILALQKHELLNENRKHLLDPHSCAIDINIGIISVSGSTLFVPVPFYCRSAPIYIVDKERLPVLEWSPAERNGVGREREVLAQPAAA